MKVIGDYNRKGGVGKSFTLINIAAQFAEMGHKVLLLDIDSQMNLTQFFFENNEVLYDEEGNIREDAASIYEVLEGECEIRDAIHTMSFNSKRKVNNKFVNVSFDMDIIFGSKNLDYFGTDEVSVLRDRLEGVEEEYDYVFIDFPPAHNITTMVGLLACDYVISPLQLAKGASLNGYRDVLARCQEAEEDYGHDSLVILGTFYNGIQSFKADQKEMLAESYNPEIAEALSLFNTTIRLDYSSAQICEAEQAPLNVKCAKTEINKEFKELAMEILNRIEQES